MIKEAIVLSRPFNYQQEQLIISVFFRAMWISSLHVLQKKRTSHQEFCNCMAISEIPPRGSNLRNYFSAWCLPNNLLSSIDSYFDSSWILKTKWTHQWLATLTKFQTKCDKYKLKNMRWKVVFILKGHIKSETLTLEHD